MKTPMCSLNNDVWFILVPPGSAPPAFLLLFSPSLSSFLTSVFLTMFLQATAIFLNIVFGYHPPIFFPGFEKMWVIALSSATLVSLISSPVCYIKLKISCVRGMFLFLSISYFKGLSHRWTLHVFCFFETCLLKSRVWLPFGLPHLSFQNPNENHFLPTDWTICYFHFNCVLDFFSFHPREKLK